MAGVDYEKINEIIKDLLDDGMDEERAVSLVLGASQIKWVDDSEKESYKNEDDRS